MMSSFEGRDVISIKDFSREDLEYLFSVTDRIEDITKERPDLLRDKIMVLLFFEPSTRTRLSFETAMKKLGGKTVGFSKPMTASIAKGENLADTIRVVENYGDLIVLRHPMEGAARMAADFATVPVINAGSGAQEHPTQAMLDLYTIRKEKGKIDGLNIGILGDLRHARTVNSLVYGLSKYDVRLYLISHPLLRMREEVLRDISDKIEVHETEDLSEVIPELDVLYVTRIQKERFLHPSDYEKVKESYRLTPEIVQKGKEDLIIMHPLPRVDEIDARVDSLKQAVYFRQTKYGLLVRMALISLILGAIR